MTTPIQLSQAQLQMLQRIRDQPDSDAWNLKQATNCSLAELGELASMALIDIGTDRLEVDRMHPVITQAGLGVLAATEAGQAALVDAPLSAARQIERLEEGRDRGCMTDLEFKALKQDILARAAAPIDVLKYAQHQAPKRV
jgi:hypothetical protein